jgi:ADP-ribosylglycohydrolase
VFSGTPLRQTLANAIATQKNPLVGHPFSKWLDEPDEKVVGHRLSTACYIQDAVPAVVYLAMKYHHDPGQALIVCTNLGGDNVGRNSVLGALLGAEHGVEGFPSRWTGGLVEQPPDIWSLNQK